MKLVIITSLKGKACRSYDGEVMPFFKLPPQNSCVTSKAKGPFLYGGCGIIIVVGVAMAEGTDAGVVSPESSESQRVADPTPLIREEKCVFCQIIAKEVPAEILYEDAEFLCFRDIAPIAPHHYQVVPRNHIKDSKSLTRDHVSMVERMVEVGKQVLSTQGASVEDSRMGFHWPPFWKVPHLHMHLLSPVQGMSWYHKSFSFRRDSIAFVTATWLIDYLKKLKPK